MWCTCECRSTRAVPFTTTLYAMVLYGCADSRASKRREGVGAFTRSTHPKFPILLTGTRGFVRGPARVQWLHGKSTSTHAWITLHLWLYVQRLSEPITDPEVMVAFGFPCRYWFRLWVYIYCIWGLGGEILYRCVFEHAVLREGGCFFVLYRSE